MMMRANSVLFLCYRSNSEMNFQKASSTLDASVKIYGYRVDDTLNMGYRILDGFNRGEQPKQPAFGLLCGAQTLTLLIGSWILFMMPGKKEERSQKKERILAAVNILADLGIILLFILQMVTGKYYPFAAV